MTLLGPEFLEGGKIVVDRDASGAVTLHPPSVRFAETHKLHAFGTGPFCRFQIPATIATGPGVYVFLVDDVVMYVGMGMKLRSRLTQYRHIYARQAYAGGPQTTCRINSLIAAAIQADMEIVLYTMATDEPRAVEERLIAKHDPPWNRQA